MSFFVMLSTKICATIFANELFEFSSLIPWSLWLCSAGSRWVDTMSSRTTCRDSTSPWRFLGRGWRYCPWRSSRCGSSISAASFKQSFGAGWARGWLWTSVDASVLEKMLESHFRQLLIHGKDSIWLFSTMGVNWLYLDSSVQHSDEVAIRNRRILLCTVL